MVRDEVNQLNNLRWLLTLPNSIRLVATRLARKMGLKTSSLPLAPLQSSMSMSSKNSGIVQQFCG